VTLIHSIFNESLLKSLFYRDVLATIETLIRLFKINVTISVPCIHCLAEKSFNPYYFPLELCEEAAMKGFFPVF
jgi:hypothetical protein